MQPPKEVTDCLELILKQTAERCGVCYLAILGTRRTDKLARARGVFWAVTRKFTGYNYPVLSAILGRDHSSIVVAVNRTLKTELNLITEIFEHIFKNVQPLPAWKLSRAIYKERQCLKCSSKKIFQDPDDKKSFFCADCEITWIARK